MEFDAVEPVRADTVVDGKITEDSTSNALDCEISCSDNRLVEEKLNRFHFFYGNIKNSGKETLLMLYNLTVILTLFCYCETWGQSR
jgi:hypothetical protein